MLIEVTRTYVEMRDPGRLAVVGGTPPGAAISVADPCPPALYRFLYGEVGRPYHWVDRAQWTDEQIAAHVGRPDVSIRVLREGDEVAGFCELVRHEDGSVEIAYFGLLPGFYGRGLGRYLLTASTLAAWESGANRVWLHTCTLDHPAALPNYLARGFREVRRESYQVER